jgi:hypothetical protein
MIMRHSVLGLTAVLTMFTAACGDLYQAHEVRNPEMHLDDVTPDEWKRLAGLTIYFGHQSVGADILRGIREIIAQHPEIHLSILTGIHGATPTGPALIEFPVGRNGDPRSKDLAFRDFLGSRDDVHGVALYKYCYIDVDYSTNPIQLFENYRAGIAELKAKYPKLRIVHVTIPLTTSEGWVKGTVKALLYRPTDRQLNAKRHRYNRLLIAEYQGKDVIFDLARLEATRPDKTVESFHNAGEHILSLAPQLTSDGGHLNEAGRRIVAEHLLVLLATLR